MSPAGGSRSCRKKKNVHTVEFETTPFDAASVTAIRMRLVERVAPKLLHVTIQRPESRSYRTCGVAVGFPLRTGLKNASIVAFRTPSARPVSFANVRMRPFTATRNCAGPAAPVVSGGKAFESASVAPRKFEPIACLAEGRVAGADAGGPSDDGRLGARRARGDVKRGRGI